MNVNTTDYKHIHAKCHGLMMHSSTDNDDLRCVPQIMYLGVIKSGKVRWAGHVARMGDSRGAYRVLVGRREGKRPL